MAAPRVGDDVLSTKGIHRLHEAYRDDIGDLVTRRPLPGPDVGRIDPFLFLNHHGPQVYPPDNRGLPFGPHPHRGFETVTFIVAGELAHRDSAGHESVIRAGGVQWMTAGRGIVHEEVSPREFLERGGAMEILQLWVNLPARLKMTEPRYIGLQRDAVPAVPTGDGEGVVNLVAGTWNGATGPVESLTGVFMSTIEIAAGGRARFGGVHDRNVLLYVVRGRVRIGATDVPEWVLAELTREGDDVEIHALQASLLLFGHAQAIGEPVAAHGPFVMNTRDEIVAAIRDYESGRF